MENCCRLRFSWITWQLLRYVPICCPRSRALWHCAYLSRNTDDCFFLCYNDYVIDELGLGNESGPKEDYCVVCVCVFELQVSASLSSLSTTHYFQQILMFKVLNDSFNGTKQGFFGPQNDLYQLPSRRVRVANEHVRAENAYCTPKQLTWNGQCKCAVKRWDQKSRQPP